MAAATDRSTVPKVPGMTETACDPRQSRSVGGWRKGLKIALACGFLTLALLALAESVVRLGGYDDPLAGAVAFASNTENDPIHRTDSTLFYSLRPGMDTMWQGAEVSTNEYGLRGPEIGTKGANEFRILSLGESSTFGAGVADHETYSAVLEELLQARDDWREYRVINAGVSGYTSFQSLKYLELRGLDLAPDLVLFYHEVNDDLPAHYSDRELFDSQAQSWRRKLAEWSAVYRAISAHMTARKLAAQRASQSTLQAKSESVSSDATFPGTNGLAPPTGRVRVSTEERRRNFQELIDLCEIHGIKLVFMHPAYAESMRHSCELTEFCERGRHHLFESYDSLHPTGSEPSPYFLDECHPTRRGHRALASDLCDFLIEIQAVPHAD